MEEGEEITPGEDGKHEIGASDRSFHDLFPPKQEWYLRLQIGWHWYCLRLRLVRGIVASVISDPACTAPLTVVLFLPSHCPYFSASSCSGSGYTPSPALLPSHPPPARSSYSSSSFLLLPFSFLLLTSYFFLIPYYVFLIPSPPTHCLYSPAAPPPRSRLNTNMASRIFGRPWHPPVGPFREYDDPNVVVVGRFF